MKKFGTQKGGAKIIRSLKSEMMRESWCTAEEVNCYITNMK